MKRNSALIPVRCNLAGALRSDLTISDGAPDASAQTAARLPLVDGGITLQPSPIVLPAAARCKR